MKENVGTNAHNQNGNKNLKDLKNCPDMFFSTKNKANIILLQMLRQKQ